MLSVVIPVYNPGTSNLRICLDSLSDQTCKDFEVIMIDDGSTDGCAAVCDDYSAKNAKFRTIHQKNSGVAHARNRGIEAAKGEYITFIDSDDYVAREHIQSYLGCIELYHPDMIICDRYYRDESGNIHEFVFSTSKLENEEIHDERILASFLNHELPSGLWLTAMRTQLSKNHMLDERIGFYEDLDYILSISREAINLRIIDKPTYYYRSGSYTHGRLTAKTLTCFRVIDKLRASVGQRGLTDEMINQLQCDFVISTIMIGAKDKYHEKSLDRVVKERAKQLVSCKSLKKSHKREQRLVRMIAISPDLYYCLYRLLHRGSNKAKGGINT